MNNTAIAVNTLIYCNNLDIMCMICYYVTGLAVKTKEKHYDDGQLGVRETCLSARI